MEKDLVEFIARSLVDSPDEVEIKVLEGEKSVILELKVAPDDYGKVIGRKGRIAKAMKVVLNAASIKTGRRVGLDIPTQ